MNKSKPPFLLYILMILAMAAWGLSWSNAKVLGQYAPATVLIFWRFLISSIAMVPVLFFKGQNLSISKKGFTFAVGGAIFISLYNYLFFVGTHIGSAGIGGVIVPTLNPILTLAGSVVIFRQVFLRKDIYGLLLGLIGGSIVLKVWDFSFDQITNSGNIYFVVASFCWTGLTLTSSRSHRVIQTLTFSFWVYFISAMFYFPFVIQNEWMSVFNMDWIFWLHLISVSIGAMVFGTTVYFIGTTKLGSEKASAFIFTVPVTAILFSMLILKEPLEISTAVGGLLAMTAVYLINKKHPQREPID